ncbi:MAG: class I SAM-dependent methyltransferase [Erysipelotrichia bacterium]|jgi:SAM-dependent methyltransferase|nr:class I SAM-dependent methyltransferase [Erysipelotrichia bacterium]
MKHRCPLCYSILTFTSASSFSRCIECDAYVKNPLSYLTPSQDIERYKLHKNSLDNQSYLDFLTPLANLILKHVPSHSLGLDFGCGPVFALEKCLNHKVNLQHYDLYFYPHLDAFKHTYDFIECSEVIEHLHHPKKELERLIQCLKHEGLLFIQTHRHDEVDHLESWYYAKDPTHVFLISLKTCEHIAHMFNCEIIEVTPRCVVFQKR